MQHESRRVAKFLNIPGTGSHANGIFERKGHTPVCLSVCLSMYFIFEVNLGL